MAARQALGLLDMQKPLNEEQITKAFRLHAKQAHPDMPGGCARALSQLIEARLLLLDHIGHGHRDLTETTPPPFPLPISPKIAALLRSNP